VEEKVEVVGYSVAQDYLVGIALFPDGVYEFWEYAGFPYKTKNMLILVKKQLIIYNSHFRSNENIKIYQKPYSD
jgi:hypothetical protein